jgi:hypothetical protein
MQRVSSLPSMHHADLLPFPEPSTEANPTGRHMRTRSLAVVDLRVDQARLDSQHIDATALHTGM